MPTIFLAILLAIDTPANDHVAAAKSFIEAMNRADYAAAFAPFDATMQKAMPIEKLKETWEAVNNQVGPFKQFVGSRSEPRSGFDRIFVTCEFEKAKLDVRVVFDKDHKIAGLGFQPAKPPVEYKSPEYVDPKSFSESEVTLNPESEWKLGGTLTLPNGEGPFPVVVLVHGSGSHDRDETLGSNKPFKDLAGGLASRGIAVLRYDKRNYVHQAKIKVETFTINEEVLDDVHAAVKLVKNTPKIDAKRIYVIGHSLGAMAAPKIAATDSDLAGIVLMAGAARPLQDLIIEQLTYIGSLPGPNGEGAKKMLADVRESLAKVGDPKLLAEMKDSERPMGMPPAYWRSLKILEPAPTAGKLTCRVLVLHGDRDYQITLDDFALFEKALAGKSNATLKRFANLNHLFMDGQGKATPEEYQKAGNVAKEVIETIATWAKTP